MPFYLFVLFLFWTMFGSFASVIIYRLKSKEWWILTGRSHCKSCERYLSPIELIPIISWLMQWGKCAGCRKKISAIYPILELSMWILFAAVWVFVVPYEMLSSWWWLSYVSLGVFLSVIFLTVIYVFYDILYLLIPESILASLNIILFATLIAQSHGFQIIPYLPVWEGVNYYSLALWIIILSAMYYIMLAGLKEIYDILITGACIVLLWGYMWFFSPDLQSDVLLSATLAAFAIYMSFFLQIIISGWKWMWAWDLRIAIAMGYLVGFSFAFPAWMICYFSGSIIGIGLIIYHKIKNGVKTTFSTQIPFGPFIACG